MLPPSVAAHVDFQLHSLQSFTVDISGGDDSEAAARNANAASAELFSMCESHGTEAHIFLFCRLLEALIAVKAEKNEEKYKILSKFFVALINLLHLRPYFEVALAAAAEKKLMGLNAMFSFEEVGERFCASAPQKLAFGMALVNMENNAKAISCGKELIAKILTKDLQKVESFPPAIVHKVLKLFSRDSNPLRTNLIAALSKLDLTRRDWSLLQPIVLESQSGVPSAEGMHSRAHLAGIMEENGYACAASSAIFRKILDLIPKLDRRSVAEVLGLICSKGTGLETKKPEGLAVLLGSSLSLEETTYISTWNQKVVIETLSEAMAPLTWKDIMYSFDYPKFHIASEEMFEKFVRLCRDLTGEQFPVDAICGRIWSNSRGQLSFLKYAVSCPEVLSFKRVSDVPPVLDSLEEKAAVEKNACWLSTQLLDTLYELADTSTENFKEVLNILEFPKQHFPEHVLVTSASCPASWRQVNRETVDFLIKPYIAGHPNSNKVLERVWLAANDAVVRAMLEGYTRDPTSITRALDICQELKILVPVLKLSPFAFMLDLAALAARREYLNLEKWLGETVQERGHVFIAACLDFMDEKFRPSDRRSSNQIYLSPESAQIFLRFLVKYQEAFGEAQQIQFKRIIAQMSAMQPAQAARSASGFAPDVEDEANANFQNIYGGQQSIRDAVSMLTNLKNSTNERENEIFACMMHNLFDEYRFFPQYPDKELLITAKLFGELVQNQLVSSVTLSIALRYILDALSKPPASKMFTFGKNALEQFMTRLHEWPKFCSHLLMIPNIRNSFPSLVQYLESPAVNLRQLNRGTELAADSLNAAGQMPDIGIAPDSYMGQTVHNIMQGGNSAFEPHGSKQASTNSAAAAAAAAAAAVRTSQSGGLSSRVEGDMMTDTPRSQILSPTMSGGLNPQAATMSPSSLKLDSALQSMPQVHFTLNTETLETAALKQTFAIPSDAVADKIHFAVNNLSTSNIAQKSEDIKSRLKSEYYPWFANYMIVKRVAQEPNFHTLYLSLITQLGSSALNKHMIRTTIQYVKILIKSERIKTQSSDRSLLKNLGSWLGQSTIAKEKPILHKELDLKGVIIDAYEKGKMIAVIPFIHKVLEPCKKTKVFAPPNPWVIALCSLLTEIYSLNKLKLNLKFEIEMMFKDLDLHPTDIKPSNIVSGRAREMFGNPDFTVDKNAQPMPSATTESQKPAAASVASIPRSADAADSQRSVTSAPAQGASDIPMQGDWMNFVKVTTSTCMGVPGVKKVLANAMESSVREVVAPVVERSVNISCMTTRELVLKDFAFESDESRIRQAARWMVAALASSLALVTCKEPLRVSLTNHIWQMLHRTGIPEDVLEQSVNAEVAENIDFCCTVIERHAIDKAIRSMDEALHNSYMLRRKHTESKSTAQFLDPTVLQGQLPNLPEALHPSLAGVQHQFKVYEEFAKIQRLLTNAGDVNAGAQQPPVSGETRKPASALHPVPSGAAAAVVGDVGVHIENLGVLLSQIDGLTLKEKGIDSPSQINQDSELKKAIQAIFEIADTKIPASNSSAREQCAKQIFFTMFQGTASKLRFRIYLALLEKLNARVSGLDIKLTEWFGTINEDIWLQRVDLAETMVRRGLLNLKELDRALSVLISARKVGPATDFAIHVVRQCIVLEPLAQANDMTQTLDVLASVAAQGRGGGAGDALAQLVEQAKRSTQSSKTSLSPEQEAKSVGSGAAAPDGSGSATAPVPAGGTKESLKTGVGAGGKEAAALREQVTFILDEWSKISDLPNRDKMATGLLVTLQQRGFLKSDEAAEQFFTLLVEVAVSHCVNSAESVQGGQSNAATYLSFEAVDAFVKLVVFLINRSANEAEAVNPAARGVRRASQLFRVLGVVVNIMQKTSKESPSAFNPRPYFRMFIGWYMELLEAAVGDEVVMIPSLAALADALLALQPLRIPAFAFSWLELISHRHFMPKLLLASGQNGWPHFQKLLLALLQFLEPYLHNAELTEPIRLMYKGTLRMLLVLLHDFPEFLCKYHFQLCDVIPSSCIQMRNLMLSAFPRNMRLPDPFTPNLKVDLLPEISESPRIVVDFNTSLKGLQVPLSTYLSLRQPADFLGELPQKLLLPQVEAVAAGTRYNVPLINAVVLYVGMNAIHKGQAIPMEIFQQLVVDLDAEGRYLLLNAIANQLRYPNSHTHYFSCVLLFLFAESSLEIVKEQITRVLLERLIVNRPHPWGLLITFIELIKNPRYQFWSHPFTRCAPEVERLFENVARSCIGQKQGEEEKKAAELAAV